MIRVAAAGDLHCRVDGAGLFAPWLGELHQQADVLLLAGDLTGWGEEAEAAVLAAELAAVRLPVLAVLGNHDYQGDQVAAVTAQLAGAGVVVLEQDTSVVEVRGETLGVAGAKGFGGGFGATCIAPFGEPAMKRFLRETYAAAEALERGLGELDTTFRIALLHYAPVVGTLEGEASALHAFLGSSLLAEPIDAAGADLVLHGHAHRGAPRGMTPGGIPVRNCAIPVLGRPYAIFELARLMPPGGGVP